MLLLTKERKQNFLHGATILMASMIIVKIVGAIFKIPLGSILKESGMAYFSTAYTLYNTVYALTVTGLSAAVARMVAENVTRGRYRDVRKLLRLSTVIFIVLGTLGFLFVLFFARPFTVSVKNPNAYWSVVMIAPAIFFCCIMASYRGYYEGLSNMKPTAVTQVVEVLSKLIVGLAFAVIVMGIADKMYSDTGVVFGIQAATKEESITAALPFASAAALLGVSVSTLIGFVYIFIQYKLKGDYITREMLKQSPRPFKAKVLVYRLAKLALPVTMGAVVIQLSALIDMSTIMNRLDFCYEKAPDVMAGMYGALLMDGERMSEFLYGCFGIAVNIFNLVPAFTNIFGKSALPNVTSAWVAKDKSRIKLNIESVIRVTMLVAAPASFGIAFMSKPILQLLYPAMPGVISVGGQLLIPFGIGALFLSLVTPMNAIMQGIGRADLPVKYLFIGAMVKLIMNVILIGIPTINIMGGAVSTLFCYGIIAFLSISKLRQVVRIRLNLKSILIKPLVSGVICGFSAFLCYQLLSIVKVNSIITILSILVGAVFYIISLAVFNAISRDDVMMLPKANKIIKILEKVRIIR